MNNMIIDEAYLKFECGNVQPSIDEWLNQAKKACNDNECGIFLTHNGVVRSTSKNEVQSGKDIGKKVLSLDLSADKEKIVKLCKKVKTFDGINYLRIWINEGQLKVGDNMMIVLLGSQTRKQAVYVFDYLMDKLKNECLNEDERFV